MLSPQTQKLLAAQRKPSFPYLIQVIQSGYPDMFFVNSSDNVSFMGNIYNAASFSIQPPEAEGAKIGNATLAISAVDQYWIQRIRETQIPAEIKFIAVIVDDGNGGAGVEALEENSFTLRAASWDEAVISWEMSFDERQNYIITSVKCTPQVAPGCA